MASASPGVASGDRPGSERSSAADTGLVESATSDESGIICIATGGDIVLKVAHESKGSPMEASFRVSTSALKQNSKFFARLLEAGRFGEGAEVEAKHKSLGERYKSMAEVPTTQLPVVSVQDVGRISAIKSLAGLVTDFLNILHGKDTQAPPPVTNLANLAIVADRFDAMEVLKSYVRRKKTIRAIDGKTTPKADGLLSEEKVRQRVLVAVMLDYPAWLEKYSARIVTKGWVGRDTELTAPLWWDLPSRLEEELAYRRDCVLETVQSLVTYFVGQYASRERQCRLGYDSSPQCDSFQLGEIIRFFMRAGLLKLQGAVFDASEPLEPFTGDVYVLLDGLRQVPEYQIDRNHTHCGIRTRITPLLDLIAEALVQVGICPTCWAEDRRQYTWMDAKRPLLWKKQHIRLRTPDHTNRHGDLRAMFTATERDWS